MSKIRNNSEYDLFAGIESVPARIENISTNISAPQFSLFNPPITNIRPCKNISLEDVWYIVKLDGLKAKTDKVRVEPDADRQNELKKSILPYCTFSGTFTIRRNENLIGYSGYICVDLDHIDIRLTDTLAGDSILNPVLIFVSPRGKGLKLVIYINNAKAENHLLYFNALEKYFQDTYQLAIDTGCKDFARACFLCHDPDVYYNPEGSINSDVLLSYLPDLPMVKPDEMPATNPPEIGPVNVDQKPDAKPLPKWTKIPDDYQKPSERLNRLPAIENRAKIALENAGWVFTPDRENCARPGKNLKAGTSGRFNRNPKDGLMYFTNFSSNAGIPAKGYTSAQIICLYEFKDNWDACISSLVKEYLPQQQSQNPDPKQSTPDNKAASQEEDPPPTGKRSKLPPTPPLPIDGMPKFYQEYIKTSAKVYGSHQDYHAGGAIMAAALGIGDNIELRTQYGNVPILWTANVGGVSSGKTQPQDQSMGVFQKLDIAAYDRWKIDYNEFELTSIKDRKAMKMQPPVMFQFIVKDITPEKMQKVHSVNQRGLIYSVDEFIGLIQNFQTYNKSGEESNLLSSYSRITMVYNRVGGGPDSNIIIKNPCILLYGGIQPNILPELVKGNRSENGFLSRMCNIWPDSQPLPDYNELTFPDDLLARFENHIMKLIQLTKRTIKLSPAAQKIYAEWYNQNQDATRKEQSEHLRGVYQKLNYFVLRLAVVIYGMYLSTGERDFTDEIKVSVMQTAIDITEYFRATALKVNEKLFAQRTDADKTREVIRFLSGMGHSQPQIADIVKKSQPYIHKVLKSPEGGYNL